MSMISSSADKKKKKKKKKKDASCLFSLSGENERSLKKWFDIFSFFFIYLHRSSIGDDITHKKALQKKDIKTQKEKQQQQQQQ